MPFGESHIFRDIYELSIHKGFFLLAGNGDGCKVGHVLYSYLEVDLAPGCWLVRLTYAAHRAARAQGPPLQRKACQKPKPNKNGLLSHFTVVAGAKVIRE